MNEQVSTATSPGCVILLVDESAAMAAVMGDVVADGKPSTKPTSERVATSLNALLNQLSSGPGCDVAIVGYKSQNGQVDVGCRWGGPLAGREFVPARELSEAPIRLETRTRRTVAADGSIREETVEMPVWYCPSLGEKAPQVAALAYCQELLSRWRSTAPANSGAPLMMHLFSGTSCDGNPHAAALQLMEMSTAGGGGALLFQAHIAPSAALVTTQYPSSLANLTIGAPRDLFARVSKLPAHLQDSLKAAKIVISANARGMLHNAKVADVIRFLSLIKTHIVSCGATPGEETAVAMPGGTASVAPADRASLNASQPPPDAKPTMARAPADETPPRLGADGAVGLVLLVLDRSIDSSMVGNPENSCTRLQQQANELLKQLTKMKDERVDVGILSYGGDAAHHPQVGSTFEGPLAGKSFVPHTQLPNGALRVEEHEEQVSNGIGGLVSVTRKTPVYFDVAPAEGVPPTEVFAAAGRVIADWAADHPTGGVSPMILHLTRGQCDGVALELALSELRSSSQAAAKSAIYHLILTESLHKSLAYPESDVEIGDPSLKHLWKLSSSLGTGERQEADSSTTAPGPRGFVINGKFDAFLECVKRAIKDA